ncbi:MAG TPA: iron ABC transporter permease [Bacteroidales bacterium]|nr:iron ABC transporter permease [Bacteroidales bacterium]
MTNRRSVIIFTLLLLLLPALAWLNLIWGSVSIPIAELLNVLQGKSSENQAFNTIILHFRIPQLLTAMVTGAALAVAGLLLQTLFRNPLADPSILGISSGASLGVAFLLFGNSMLTGHAYKLSLLGPVGIVTASFAGAVTVLFIITLLSRMMSSMTSLLIAGIMMGYLAAALTGIVKYFSNKEDLQAFVVWGMGSFTNVSRADLPFFGISLLIGLFASLLMIKPLNLLLLGDSYAANLGLRIRPFRTLVLLLTGYLTAVTTAYTGPIAFLGLAVPHLARNLFKTSNHGILVPASMLIGAGLALTCNLIARLPGFDGSLPINAVTALIGAPVVVYVLVKRYRSTPSGI